MHPCFGKLWNPGKYNPQPVLRSRELHFPTSSGSAFSCGCSRNWWCLSCGKHLTLWVLEVVGFCSESEHIMGKKPHHYLQVALCSQCCWKLGKTWLISVKNYHRVLELFWLEDDFKTHLNTSHETRQLQASSNLATISNLVYCTSVISLQKWCTDFFVFAEAKTKVKAVKVKFSIIKAEKNCATLCSFDIPSVPHCNGYSRHPGPCVGAIPFGANPHCPGIWPSSCCSSAITWSSCWILILDLSEFRKL